VVLASGIVDLRTRAGGPESVAREYFAALERSDAEGAIATLAPNARQSSRAFVENGLGNDYHVAGVAVRNASMLDRLRGEPAGPRDVTTFLSITEAASGAQWQASPRVSLVAVDSHWYLARPPLAPD